MKSSLKKIKDSKIRLSVEVEAERVEARYQEVLRDFQRSARLPGFREGKAPVDLVEKKFAREAEEETLKALIPEAYHQSVVSHKVSPVSLPSISEIQFQRGRTLTFTAEFEPTPEFSVKNYKGIKIRKAPIDVSAEDVEKGIASLLDSKAELVPVLEPRGAQKGDALSVDIELWRNGAWTPARKGVLLFAEPHETDDFFEKVLGARVNEVREILVDPSDEEKKQGLIGRRPLYKVWIRGIHEKKLPLLDEVFASQFGKATVEELRETVRKDISRYKTAESQAKMKEELVEKLLAMHAFVLPESLVQKQKERLFSDTERRLKAAGFPEAKREEERQRLEAELSAKASEQVKLYFLLGKIADNEDIEIDEAELEARLAGIVEESKRPLDEVRSLFEQDLRESLREKKTLDFLLANAKFEE